MATGTVYYWNGDSGWIKQSGVDNLPTAQARDIMLLNDDVVSGTVAQNSLVSFTIPIDDDNWQARVVTVTG